jgi:hypothetical protein
MQITLPDDLGKKLEERVAQSNEFPSVEAYVQYVLGEVLKQTEATYTADQEAAVKERLENLGYLE